MQKIFVAVLASLLILLQAIAQQPDVNISYSPLYTSYQFARKLSAYYPDNPYKQLVEGSKFNSPVLNAHIARLDTLDLNEAYEFQGYPYMQKIPGTSIALLERNLISSKTVQEFKARSFGIVPNESLLLLCETLTFMLPLTDALLYDPNRQQIEEQVNEFKSYVAKANLAEFFTKAQKFYGAVWDADIPITITIVPSPTKKSFSAKAFLNNAAIELPLKFSDYDVLTGVLMHEIFHLLYDGQPKEDKLTIDNWFAKHPSACSRYAYLLFNEALATSLGNGYVYEQLHGSPDKSDWYDVKYINKMARQMYPLVRSYITLNKSIDQDFVQQYIDLYTQHFSDWLFELDNVMANRYLLAEGENEFVFFRSHFPRYSSYQNSYPIGQAGIDRLKQTPVTKIIIVSKDREQTLKLIKENFEELSEWQYDAGKEFAIARPLQDKTLLIIVNKIESSLEKLFSKYFSKGRIVYSN